MQSDEQRLIFTGKAKTQDSQTLLFFLFVRLLVIVLFADAFAFREVAFLAWGAAFSAFAFSLEHGTKVMR